MTFYYVGPFASRSSDIFSAETIPATPVTVVPRQQAEGATERRGRQDDVTFELLTEDGYEAEDGVVPKLARRISHFPVRDFGPKIVSGYAMIHPESEARPN